MTSVVSSTPPTNSANDHAIVIQPRAVFDLLLLIGVIALTICLDVNLVIVPTQRVFSPCEHSIGYPYIPEDQVKVNWKVMLSYILVVPIASMILIDTFVRRTTAERSIKRITYYVTSLCITDIITSVIALGSSSMTPDFLSRCNLQSQSFSNISCTALPLSSQLVSPSLCTGPSDILFEGYHNFPNRLATLTMFSMLFTSYYIRNHVPFTQSRVLPYLLYLLPLIGGLYASVTQFADNRGSGWAVAFGIALGLAAATVTQTVFFGGMKRSYKGEDVSELREFLSAHAKPIEDPSVAAALSATLSKRMGGGSGGTYPMSPLGDAQSSMELGGGAADMSFDVPSSYNTPAVSRSLSRSQPVIAQQLGVTAPPSLPPSTLLPSRRTISSNSISTLAPPLSAIVAASAAAKGASFRAR
jgi:hypothetical protein